MVWSTYMAFKFKLLVGYRRFSRANCVVVLLERLCGKDIAVMSLWSVPITFPSPTMSAAVRAEKLTRQVTVTPMHHWSLEIRLGVSFNYIIRKETLSKFLAVQAGLFRSCGELCFPFALQLLVLSHTIWDIASSLFACCFWFVWFVFVWFVWLAWYNEIPIKGLIYISMMLYWTHTRLHTLYWSQTLSISFNLTSRYQKINYLPSSTFGFDIFLNYHWVHQIHTTKLRLKLPN